eukprot:11188175-Lingulodinium_polyedra.AAC.1
MAWTDRKRWPCRAPRPASALPRTPADHDPPPRPGRRGARGRGSNGEPLSGRHTMPWLTRRAA